MNQNEKPQPVDSVSPDAQTSPAEAGRSRGRRRGLLIGAAAAVALIAVGGSAYAIGAAIGDDHDDDRSPAASDTRSGADRGSDRNDRDREQSGDGRGDATGGDRNSAGSNPPPADVAALRAAADKAIAESDAKGVTSIDVRSGGYEVDVQLADGSEPGVFVAVDGTVTVGTDRPDDRLDPILDLGALDGISKAAVAAAAEAGGADGTIDSISTTGESGVAYEVSIRLPDGRSADIDLASDLAVVSSDIDDD